MNGRISARGACATSRTGIGTKPVTSRPKPVMLRQLARARQHLHLADAEFAQDLRADAIGACRSIGAALRARRPCLSSRTPGTRRSDAPSSRRSSAARSRRRSRAAISCIAASQRPRMRGSRRRRAGRAPTAARARAPAFPAPASACRAPARCAARRSAGRDTATARNSPCAVCIVRSADALDERFGAAAVVDQVGDRADLEPVLLRRTRSGRAGAPSCRRPS